MAELKVYLSEELDKKFRMLAMSIFGYGRGSLSEAAVEALSAWCRQRENRNNGSHIGLTSSPESDPVARAEERPETPPPTKEKTTNSPIEQGTDETSPPANKGKDQN